MVKFLERLNVYGCENVEDLILAGLLSGDPVLLVGAHGSAKTMLCENLARALGIDKDGFIAYDASKALFEDVLGYPDPLGIEKGKVRYVKTPISIQDKEFVLIDEISRANYQMQSKWLEIIRSRRIMGEELKNLKYVFAAMNPPGYRGTRLLDSALAGRFAYIVWMPEYRNLEKNVKSKVMRTMSKDDAILVNKEKGTFEDVGLLEFLDKARGLITEFERKYGEIVERFIHELEEKLNDSNLALDGRRASMIRRSLIYLLCVAGAKGVNVDEALPDIFLLATYLLPYPVENEEIELEHIEIIVHEAVLSALKKLPSREWIDEVSFSKLEERFGHEEDTDRKYLVLERMYKIGPQSSGTSVAYRFVRLHESLFGQTSLLLTMLLRQKGSGRLEFTPEWINANRLTLGILRKKENEIVDEGRWDKIAVEIHQIALRRKEGK